MKGWDGRGVEEREEKERGGKGRGKKGRQAAMNNVTEGRHLPVFMDGNKPDLILTEKCSITCTQNGME